MKKFLLILAVLFALCLVACDSSSTGDVTIFIGGSMKSLSSVPMETKEYEVQILSGETVLVSETIANDPSDTTSLSVTLPVASYSVEVTALNANKNVIGSGSSSFVIKKNTSVTCSVVVDENEGDGALSFSIDFDSQSPCPVTAQVFSPSDLDTPVLTTVLDTVEDRTITGSISLSRGYYLVTLSAEGMKFDTFSVRIVAGTSVSYSSELDLSGSVSITIDNTIQKTPEITIGLAKNIFTLHDDAFTVTASSTGFGTKNYSWYLDDEELVKASTSSNLTIDPSGLAAGHHKLTVVISDGNVLWSEDAYFTVLTDKEASITGYFLIPVAEGPTFLNPERTWRYFKNGVPYSTATVQGYYIQELSPDTSFLNFLKAMGDTIEDEEDFYDLEGFSGLDTSKVYVQNTHQCESYRSGYWMHFYFYDEGCWHLTCSLAADHHGNLETYREINPSDDDISQIFSKLGTIGKISQQYLGDEPTKVIEAWSNRPVYGWFAVEYTNLENADVLIESVKNADVTYTTTDQRSIKQSEYGSVREDTVAYFLFMADSKTDISFHGWIFDEERNEWLVIDNSIRFQCQNDVLSINHINLSNGKVVDNNGNIAEYDGDIDFEATISKYCTINKASYYDYGTGKNVPCVYVFSDDPDGGYISVAVQTEEENTELVLNEFSEISGNQYFCRGIGSYDLDYSDERYRFFEFTVFVRKEDGIWKPTEVQIRILLDVEAALAGYSNYAKRFKANDVSATLVTRN